MFYKHSILFIYYIYYLIVINIFILFCINDWMFKISIKKDKKKD